MRNATLVPLTSPAINETFRTQTGGTVYVNPSHVVSVWPRDGGEIGAHVAGAHVTTVTGSFYVTESPARVRELLEGRR